MIYIDLKSLLQEKGMTAIELSKITGISPEHLSVIKNGKTSQIRFETIEKFLDAFQIEPNELFTRVTDK